MSSESNDISILIWNPDAKEKFGQLIGKVPVFMREMAQAKVLKKLNALLKQENRSNVTEKDMVDAFFAATPFGFHGPMKTDMEASGIDYEKYGHPK